MLGLLMLCVMLSWLIDRYCLRSSMPVMRLILMQHTSLVHRMLFLLVQLHDYLDETYHYENSSSKNEQCKLLHVDENRHQNHV